jgi:hypothetical protein
MAFGQEFNVGMRNLGNGTLARCLLRRVRGVTIKARVYTKDRTWTHLIFKN